MGKLHNSIQPAHREFIENQHIFFVATAPLSAEGRVNLSPKGLDCFRVLSETEVAYMDLISSGNETSAHTRENGRITFMFCSFEGKPNILRLYGKGRAVLRNTEEWAEKKGEEGLRDYIRDKNLVSLDGLPTDLGVQKL